MRSNKKLKRLLSLFCAVSLLFSVIGIPVSAVTCYTVTAATETVVKQGTTAYCYVYINSTESLAALDVSVHFDPEKVRILDIYNSVVCEVYDSAKNDSAIQFSYIFNGEGTAEKTELFCFAYEVLSGVPVGSAWFDITVGEAYNSALEDVSVSGSRCRFTVTETTAEKECEVYSISSVSTAVAEEFTLNYRFSTNEIASGTAQIVYDSELFEVVEVDGGPFLDGKIADINADLPGTVYLSFVGTEYGSEMFLLSVKFRTLKNVSETTKITFTASELCDLDLNSVACTGCATDVTVHYDESYVGDAPTMGVSASYDETTELVTAVIRLESKSRLGAGDFVLLFDPEMLELVSCEKGFTPNFFNINDKETAQGVLKFSVISLSDIITEETVLTLTFSTVRTCAEQTTILDLSGSMITDSLTKPIVLNFANGNATIPQEHTYSGACDTRCDLCGASRSVDTSHGFDDVLDTHCNNCDHVRTVTSISITALPNKTAYLEGKDLLDVTGGKIRLVYDDGTSGVADMAVSSVSGFNNAVSGTQTLTVTYGGCSDNFRIEITPKTVTGIRVATPPAKSEYLEAYDVLDLTGGKLELTYNNGTTGEIPLSAAEVAGFDNTRLGEQTLSVKYSGKETTLTVTIVEKSLSSIAVAKNPDTMCYVEGASFDPAGMAMTLYYNNGTREVIYSGWTVDYNFNTPGTKTVTVTYGGKTTQLNGIVVDSREVTQVMIVTPANKHQYLEGQQLDLTGLTIRADYNDGSNEILNSGWQIQGFDPNVPGEQIVSICFGGKSATFEVIVNEKSLDGINITSKPSKLTYLEGDALSTSGLVVKANYNNGTSANVTDYTISGFSSTSGRKTITVSYGGKTATFEVTVNAKSLTGISITSKPKKLTYIQGEKLDLTGLVVKASYNNGTSANVTDYTVSGFDTNKVGQQTVTVTYGKKTASFAVTVESAVPEAITSNKHTVSGGYLRKVSTGTSVAELTAGINEKEYVKVFRGEQEVSGNAVIGTGMVVKIMDGNTVKATVTVVVTGDTNGDGKSTVTDMLAVKSHLLKKSNLSGAPAQAADTSKDGGISITDFIQIKASILGKGTITPN